MLHSVPAQAFMPTSKRRIAANLANDRAIQRVRGDWAGSGVPGIEFEDPDHLYSADLNLFGEGSLLERICTARSAADRRGIADLLVHPPEVAETVRRQEAVQEPQAGWNYAISLRPSENSSSLSRNGRRFPSGWTRRRCGFLAGCGPCCWAPRLPPFVAWPRVGSGVLPWIWLTPLAVLHTTVGLLFLDRFRQMTEWAPPMSFETQVLREGLELLETGDFQTD